VLIKIRFLYNVTTFRPVNTDVSKYRSSFIFRVKWLKVSVRGLLGPVHKGCASFRNVRNYLPVDHAYYKNSELHECVKKGSTCGLKTHENISYYAEEGTAVAQWLRCCTSNRKVVGSIPAGVIGIFR